MQQLTLAPAAALAGEVSIPGSKSISNRALLLAAQARGRTRIQNLLESDDTERMLTALAALGIEVQQTADEHIVTGVAGPLVNRNLNRNEGQRNRCRDAVPLTGTRQESGMRSFHSEFYPAVPHNQRHR